MKKILIIEDNFEVRENLAEILMLSNYTAIEAENGKEGIKQAIETLPDLILCDVMMPELDGFGVLKIINKHPKLMHIPFMFLTAKSEKSDFRKGMGLGADDYITKPFDDVELLEAIEMRLQKHEKLQALENSQHNHRQFFDEAKGEEEFKKLSQNREERKYRKKDFIYEYGQYPKWLFYVVSGQIKCFQTNELGKELITHVYGPGDFFGFLPLLTDAKYSDSTMAIGESIIRMIPPDDFKTLLFNNRDMSAKFMKILANYSTHSERQLIDLAYSSVRRKVANALLVMNSNCKESEFKIMREDLAGLAGTAKETTIRTISDFKSEGLIKIENGLIKIIDQESLEAMPQ